MDKIIPLFLTQFPERARAKRGMETTASFDAILEIKVTYLKFFSGIIRKLTSTLNTTEWKSFVHEIVLLCIRELTKGSSNIH